MTGPGETTVASARVRLGGPEAWLIWVLATTFVVWLFAIQTGYAVVSPEIQKSAGLSLEQIGLAAYIYTWVFAVVQFFSGALLDRFGSRPLLAIAVGFVTVGAFLYAGTTDFAVLALAQFMGWDLGIDMEKALAAYAVLSSPTGALALANVKPGAGGFLPFDPDPEDRDVDVSSFEAWSVETDDDFDEFAGDLSTEPSEESAEESAFS